MVNDSGLYLTLNLEIYSIERDDRLILLNGHKIRTKEKLIEKLAQDQGSHGRSTTVGQAWTEFADRME